MPRRLKEAIDTGWTLVRSWISAIAAEASIVDAREAITMTRDDRRIAAAHRPFCILQSPKGVSECSASVRMRI
ncbi:hypothetical protein CH63R_10631 [Colletotrichum higginsianum IMI 349063]|uniref:Uncharacterized protein n=1 Tax=Colletotrichum higginsianum (strain IMI 349063) TaxID=759273 RepID=A0A1B7Y3C3_COLHI|nr:uncharacterized protein CH63R_10631 [Colletotrichum higginsianum IMI 349063]OBR06511.1 hypothetical protein CH63R_10631 [Colletotrichum higginsianum IMI 349063]